ncbi:MAG: zwf, glucose-6-phosphate 1-dehydrogenase [Candidatus Saccharibacteria bacterium]|nr:zwf, glucose-6-phosphate 1-dehydrogenase [Candidatus Saccharibacteria bacterium]
MKTTLVIFGITGDLAQRKLLPALANVIEADQASELTIIGVSRRAVEQYQVLGDHQQLSGTTSMLQMDLDNPEDYQKLRTYIAQTDDEQVLFYLSVPPESASGIVENLGKAGMNGQHNKLLLEKPFGRDLASAQAMIDHTAEYFHESQIYRIDHYLAKEMAQNIVTFRARNAIFSYLWSNEYIERIEVIALESIGIEGRTSFYEQTGALRDIVQGHLLQLLALTLAPLPGELNWDSLPTRRMAALDAITTVNPTKAVRAQYDTYRQEVGNPESLVETFVSVELESSDPSWTGVPLALTTGKSLDRKKTEVRVHFRRMNDTQSNYLIFKIQPDEGIAIDLVTKKPGYDMDVEHQKLSYMYPADQRLPDAYEQVLVDAMNSRKSLFATSGEVLRAWEILAPLQQAWSSKTDIATYTSGMNAAAVISEATQSNQQQTT